MKSPTRFALLLLLVVAATACDPGPVRLRVLAAASLRGAMEEIAARYEREYPDRRVEVESGGSNTLARRVLDLSSGADALFLADAALFGELLQPEWTSSHLRYASDRMVLAYTELSAGADEIDAGNWPEILLRPDVTLGMADPGTAPVGYRTLMTLQLYDRQNPGRSLAAEIRARVGDRHLRADVGELLAPLQAGAVDYAFLYAATAAAANLQSLELPAEINLGDWRLGPVYARAAVPASDGRTRRIAAPIVYAAAIPDMGDLRPEAIDFLRMAFDAEGRELLRRRGLVPIEGADRPVSFGLAEDIEAMLAETAPH